MGPSSNKEIPPDVVWPEPPADLDPSIDWRLWPDIDPADRRSSAPRGAGDLNQDHADADARERYNREARAKAERLRQAGGWPTDPINNPDHPLHQPPDQRES